MARLDPCLMKDAQLIIIPWLNNANAFQSVSVHVAPMHLIGDR
jgi:hypothetical protein